LDRDNAEIMEEGFEQRKV